MKTILFIYGYGGSPSSNTCALLGTQFFEAFGNNCGEARLMP